MMPSPRSRPTKWLGAWCWTWPERRAPDRRPQRRRGPDDGRPARLGGRPRDDRASSPRPRFLAGEQHGGAPAYGLSRRQHLARVCRRRRHRRHAPDSGHRAGRGGGLLGRRSSRGDHASRLDAAGAPIEEGDILVIRTDWTDQAWGDFPRFYVESPYLTEDADDWIVEPRPRAVVFDFFEEYTVALDDVTSQDFVVHRKLLGQGLPLVEQATHLGGIDRPRFRLLAPFFLLEQAEAAPCRIFAET